jgi:hypothetical protein
MATANTAIRSEQIQEATISGGHLDTYNLPVDAYVIKWNASQNKMEWAPLASLISNETPSGDVNGTNVTFTLGSTPVTGSVEVYLNGLLQKPVGEDYTINGQTITFVEAPETNDLLLASYLTQAGLAAGATTKYPTTVVSSSGTYSPTSDQYAYTFIMSVPDGGDLTFNLPSVGASDIGAWYRFTKSPSSSGILTIQTADSDVIADTTPGGTIYNDTASEVYANVTIQLISATQWTITGAHGSWTAT